MIQDKKGYLRRDHSDLVHRQRAYHHLYKKNKKDYPLPFSAYEVHHIDGKKQNNRINNLQILTPEEHDAIHDRKKRRHFKMEDIGGTFLVLIVSLVLIIGGFNTPNKLFSLLLIGGAILLLFFLYKKLAWKLKK